MTSAQLTSLLTAAQAARQRGQAAEERSLLDSALAVAPTDPRILNARGMRALTDGDFARARECFEQAATADPREPVLLVNLATACRGLADEAGEEGALKAALDLDRRHFIALLRLAELHQRTGREKEAAIGWSGIVQLASATSERPPVVEDALQRGRAFLESHNRKLADGYDATFGSELASPAARRFKACIDHSLGRRPIYTNHCSGVHYPFLPADEFFDRGHFPWLADLEAKTGIIRQEALALMGSGSDAIKPYVRQDPGTPANIWSRLDGSFDWSACFLWEYGVKNEAVCALCPETAAILEAVPQNVIPGKAPTAFFSLLKPGAHIPPHTGVTNTRAIVHLPLVVPEGCCFRVGGETRPWIEGEAFAFDDTIEHEAWNPAEQPRIVLIFDVWNPHLTPQEQDYLVRFFEVVERSS